MLTSSQSARMLATSFVLMLAASCTAWVPAPVEPYWQGRLDVAETIFRERLETSDGDWALFANELATTLEARGEVDEAWRLFFDAGRLMENWDASFGDRVAAVAGREDSREYRGEPYERALNSIYTGLLSFARGEPDNARASFREAMLRDAEQSDEQFASDFAPSFFLAAWASRAAGDRNEARAYIDEARKARADAVRFGARGAASPSVFDAFEGSNLLVMASVGRGPSKVADRHRPDLVRIDVPRQHVRAARVYVDGRYRGTTEVLGDVAYQARTRGGRWLDGVRAGKAVFSEVASTAGTVLLLEGLDREDGGLLLAGGIALLASLLVNSDADLRCWRTLPDTLQVLALDVAPGEHELFIDFVGDDGQVDRAYSRSYTIRLPPRDAASARDATSVVHVRSLPLEASLRARTEVSAPRPGGQS